jgi:hypothetical protein
MITITHTPADGTILEGTTRGDGTNHLLKPLTWRWSTNLGGHLILVVPERDPPHVICVKRPPTQKATLGPATETRSAATSNAHGRGREREGAVASPTDAATTGCGPILPVRVEASPDAGRQRLQGLDTRCGSASVV